MGCFGSDPPPPQQINYNETLASQFAAQKEFAPQALELYQTFQPGYTAADLGLAERALFGAPAEARGTANIAATPGLFNIMERAQPRLDALEAASKRAQREGELADVQALGGQYRQALQGINPDQTALRDLIYARARADLEGPGPTPFETHAFQQNYRTAARARLGNTGEAGAAAEAFYLADRRRQRELENRQLAQAMIGLDQALYGDPFLQITGRQSGSVPLAQSLFGQGQALNAGAGPRLFVPESQNAFDIAGFNANAVNAANIAAANNSAALGGALIGGIGSLGGSVFGAAGRAQGFSRLFG